MPAPFFLIFLQQFKELSIQLLSMPILIDNILASGVKHAKVTGEFPKRKSNFIFMQDAQKVIEPCQKNIVGCFIPAAALATMYSNALLCEGDPRFIIFFQHFAA